MKTFDEIISQEPVFLNDWSDKESVINDFSNGRWNFVRGEYEVDETIDRDINILFASYGCANYSGDAWVLFEKDGVLYEVNGGHCSCYGLEGQWSPEEAILKELENRLVNGTFGEDNWSDNNFKEELCKFLGVEFKRNMDRY